MDAGPTVFDFVMSLGDGKWVRVIASRKSSQNEKANDFNAHDEVKRATESRPTMDQMWIPGETIL